jgi:hypothetical protein
MLADVSEHLVGSTFRVDMIKKDYFSLIASIQKMENISCSETSASKYNKLSNIPKIKINYSHNDNSLESRYYLTH